MRFIDVLLCVVCVAGVSLGQLLFRIAALRLADEKLSLVERVASWSLVGAIGLYAAMILVWLYILGRVPLSLAFPFFGLCFFIVPLLASQFLGEPLSWRTFAGGAAILGGIILASR